jgi:hypothetical protein
MGIRLAFVLGTIMLGSNARAEMYAYYFVGQSDTADSDVHIRQPNLLTDVTYKDVSWLGKSFESPLFYGFKLGTYLKNPSWLGVEAEYLHYKVYAETNKSYTTSGTVLGGPPPAGPMDQYVQKLSISHGVNLFMLNVVARDGFWKEPWAPNGRVQVYGGAGLGMMIMHAESTINGEHYEPGYQLDDGPAAQIFAGVRAIPINLKWRYGNPTLFAEYKFAIADADFSVDQGRGDLKLRSQLFIFGLGWHF